MVTVFPEFILFLTWSNRKSYFFHPQENIDWADVIVTTGGDGTFLMAACRIQDREKPIIGFNTDPTRSEGYLCLPKKYSINICDAVRKLFEVYEQDYYCNFKHILITCHSLHLFTSQNSKLS